MLKLSLSGVAYLNALALLCYLQLNGPCTNTVILPSHSPQWILQLQLLGLGLLLGFETAITRCFKVIFGQLLLSCHVCSPNHRLWETVIHPAPHCGSVVPLSVWKFKAPLWTEGSTLFFLSSLAYLLNNLCFIRPELSLWVSPILSALITSCATNIHLRQEF